MAKSAFDHCADAYSRYRPGYPAEVFDALERLAGAPRARFVADVGAGTGKFSRTLLERGWRVIALDHSASMLAHGPGAACANITPVIALAEALPLANSAVPVLTCAQAFHWFNPPLALAEFARVLQPDGVLLLVWNNRDTADPFVADYEKLIAEWNPAYCCEYRDQDWAGKVAAARRFTPLTCDTIRWVWHMPAAAFVGFAASASYLRNVIPKDRWSSFEAALHALLARYFAAGDCQIPMFTKVWTARRLP